MFFGEMFGQHKKVPQKRKNAKKYFNFGLILKGALKKQFFLQKTEKLVAS
ncbi:MAG: hypothetical protein IKQ13_06620 [Treponema sp.]|nr:hypothetical protein [Treponema sp.]